MANNEPNKPAASPPQQQGGERTDSKTPGYKLAVEISDARNRSVLFPPARMNLRGHWSRHNLTGSENSEHIEQLPAEIPGMYVTVDVRMRRGGIFDPLGPKGPPEHKGMLDKIQAATKSFDQTKWRPQDDHEYTEMTSTQLKTWLWWMARLVQAGSAKVVSGEMPPMKEIEALPGKTRIEIYNNSATAVKFREDLPREDFDEARAALVGD